MDETKFFKPWIIFFLIATVGGFFIGAMVGGVLGFGLALAGKTNIADYQLLFQGVGFLVGIPLSFFAYKWSVKQYILKPLLAKRQEEEHSLRAR